MSEPSSDQTVEAGVPKVLGDCGHCGKPVLSTDDKIVANCGETQMVFCFWCIALVPTDHYQELHASWLNAKEPVE